MGSRAPETVTVKLLPEFAVKAAQLLDLVAGRADLDRLTPNRTTQRTMREVLKLLAETIRKAEAAAAAEREVADRG